MSNDQNQDPHAERAILGSILMAPPETAEQILQSVTDADFYNDRHRLILRAMVKTWADFQAIGSGLGLKELGVAGNDETVGGGSYLSKLALDVPTLVNWRHHRGLLGAARQRREIIAVGASCEGINEGGDPFEIAETAIARLSAISAEAPGRELPTFRDTGKRFVDWMEKNHERYKQLGRSPQWSLGWSEINDAVPLFPGKSLLLGGRSGSGKTGLALQALITSAIEYDEAGMLLSLEMGESPAFMRAISRRIGISEARILKGDLTAGDIAKLSAFIQAMGGLRLHIDSECPRDVASVDRRIRAAAKKGVKWVVIDYLQLMRWPGKKHESLSMEYGDIMYRLHRTAQKTGVGLCMLAQLRKEDRGTTPTGDSLKFGGDAVQAADVVSIIHRPGDIPREDRERAAKAAKAGDAVMGDDTMRIATAKHRYGEPCDITAGWDYGRVVPLGESWQSWSSKLDVRNTRVRQPAARAAE